MARAAHVVASVVVASALAVAMPHAAMGAKAPASKPAVVGQFALEMSRPTQKIYVSGRKVRVEPKTQPGNRTVSILLPDRKVAWILYPDRKTYVETPLSAESWQSVDAVRDPMRMRGQPGIKDVKVVGVATIAGYQCDKYAVVYSDNRGTRYVWLARKLKWPLKEEWANAHLSSRCASVREGPQPDQLFEIPAGYKQSLPVDMARPAASRKPLAPAPVREFQVTMTLNQTEEFGQVFKSVIKAYVKEPKIRVERSAGRWTTIERGDKQVEWVLDSELKTYVEAPLYYTEEIVDLRDPTQFRGRQEVKEVKLIGVETISGYQCDKYVIIYRDKLYGIERVWVARKLKWPLKIVAENPLRPAHAECTSVREGRQPDRLFEIPASYKQERLTR